MTDSSCLFSHCVMRGWGGGGWGRSPSQGRRCKFWLCRSFCAPTPASGRLPPRVPLQRPQRTPRLRNASIHLHPFAQPHLHLSRSPPVPLFPLVGALIGCVQPLWEPERRTLLSHPASFMRTPLSGAARVLTAGLDS